MCNIVEVNDLNIFKTVDDIHLFLDPKAARPAVRQGHRYLLFPLKLAGIWHITQVIGFSLDIILIIFLKVSRVLFENTPLDDLKIRLSLARKRADIEAKIQQLLHRQNFLVPTINCVKEPHLAFCLRPAANQELILRCLAKENLDILIQPLPLPQPDGICVGSVLWFIRKFLSRDKNAFHVETLLKRIASLFKNGAPRQATFIQYVNSVVSVMSNAQHVWLKDREQSRHTIGRIADDNKRKSCINTEIAFELLIEKLLKLRVAEAFYLNAEPTRGNAKTLKGVPAGVYFVHVPCHALCYVKVSDDLGFLFNPSRGLTKFEGSDHWKQVTSECNEYNAGKHEEDRFIHLLRVV